MIITKRYCIAHIPKTGGDAVKAYMQALFELGYEQDYTIHRETSESDTEKHQPFTGEEPYKVCTFRRLPSWLLSYYYHQIQYGGLHMKPFREFITRNCLADRHIKKYTLDGHVNVDLWLRCEHLGEDTRNFIANWYKVSDEDLRKIFAAPTKPRQIYDHNPYVYFTRHNLKQLYDINPLWRKLEEKLYGNITT